MGSREEKIGSDCLMGLISFEEKSKVYLSLKRTTNNKVYLSLKKKLLILLGLHPCLRPFMESPLYLE